MSVPAEIQKMKQARFFDQVADEEYESNGRTAPAGCMSGASG